MELFGILVVAAILYFLYRKGLIKNIRFPIVKIGFVYNHTKNSHVRMRYKKFNGVSTYPFVVKTNEIAQFNYDISVEEGSLELTIKHRNKVMFHKEFHNDETGNFSLSPTHKICTLIVTGKYTKGGCTVKLNQANENTAIAD